MTLELNVEGLGKIIADESSRFVEIAGIKFTFEFFKMFSAPAPGDPEWVYRIEHKGDKVTVHQYTLGTEVKELLDRQVGQL